MTSSMDFWETVLERIENSRAIVAKGYDTQVSKLFKFFFNLGASVKDRNSLFSMYACTIMVLKPIN